MRSVLFVLFAIFPQATFAGSSNHGGDGIVITFLKAQPLAADMVRSYQTKYAIDDLSNNALKNWFAIHSHELAADILASTIEPTEDMLEHDALTALRPRSTIRLSLPKLRREPQTKIQAAALLIHESMHHLGVDDELFAYFGAARIADNWERENPKAKSDPFVLNMAMPTGTETMTTDETTSKSARMSAVMVGDETFVWNGISKAFMYSPGKNTWRSLNVNGQPSSRSNYYLVWTGKEVIVWGGHDTVNRLGVDAGRIVQLEDGYAYDPKLDVWRQLSKLNAPKNAQVYHAPYSTDDSSNHAVWTGSEVVIVGGCVADRNAGTECAPTKLYNPATDTWRTASAHEHPKIFFGKAFWTGDTGNPETSNKIALVGATDHSGTFDGRVYFYAPSTDTWASTYLGSHYYESSPTMYIYHPRAAWVKNKLVVFSTIWPGFGSAALHMQVFDAALNTTKSHSLRDYKLSPQNHNFAISPNKDGLWIQALDWKIGYTLDIDSLKWRVYELDNLSSTFTRAPILWTGESILSFFTYKDGHRSKFGGHIIEFPE